MSTRKSSLFDLRAGAVDVLHLTVKTADLDALRGALRQRFDAAPDFFAGDAVVLDLRPIKDAETLDVAALAGWLPDVRLRPIGVVINDTQAGWASLTLPRLDSHAAPRKAASDTRAEPAPAAADAQAMKQAASEAAGNTGAGHVSDTVLIDKPLRSGQRIYAPGDLIVLDMVSHGAELIAGGNIHVYAPLRGRALAGAHGQAGARIFCTCFEPELVAIAGVYRTADQPLPEAVKGKPAHVLLDGDTLHIEALKLK